jgi:hypothetical protein
MIRKIFNEVVQKVPNLTAEGLSSPFDPRFAAKRQDFLNSAVYLQQANDAVAYLRGIGRSTRFSQWQRLHCSPSRLQALVEWHAGRPVSPGAIIVAALHLGFTMGVGESAEPYFNFLSRQIETELLHHRRRVLIKQVVGA